MVAHCLLTALCTATWETLMGIRRCRCIYTLCSSQRRSVLYFNPYFCSVQNLRILYLCFFFSVVTVSNAWAEPLPQVIHLELFNGYRTWPLQIVMTSNVVSCLCWVPRGAAKEKPDKVRDYSPVPCVQFGCTKPTTCC